MLQMGLSASVQDSRWYTPATNTAPLTTHSDNRIASNRIMPTGVSHAPMVDPTEGELISGVGISPTTTQSPTCDGK